MDSKLKSMFSPSRGFYYAGENENWAFFGILNFKAAHDCITRKTGGEGAYWSIGVDEEHWNAYSSNRKAGASPLEGGGNVFMLAFNKNYQSLSPDELKHNLKYLIQKDIKSGSYCLWSQADEDEGEKLSVVGTNKDKLDSMFNKAFK